MNNKEMLSNALVYLSNLVDKLSDADFKKLASGEYELSIKLVKKNTRCNSGKAKAMLDDQTLEMISNELTLANTRDEGMAVIDAHLKGKVYLELFAKHLDVATVSSDTVAKIKEAIVDATVGARIRSDSIQNRET